MKMNCARRVPAVGTAGTGQTRAEAIGPALEERS